MKFSSNYYCTESLSWENRLDQWELQNGATIHTYTVLEDILTGAIYIRAQEDCNIQQVFLNTFGHAKGGAGVTDWCGVQDTVVRAEVQWTVLLGFNTINAVH